MYVHFYTFNKKVDHTIRETAKKVLLLIAWPLRGGGGRAIKIFFLHFFILLLFANKRYLLKTTYQNINTANVG